MPHDLSYSVHDIKAFYSKRGGRLIRRLISLRINDLWPGVKGMELCGHGYALPYFRPYRNEVDRCYALMPVKHNVLFWPDNGPGCVALTNETMLPLETESVDRLLVVHGLEHAEDPNALLHEFWRVLKSNGKMIIVVPNRLGMWARADWTPFGRGVPYTHGQIIEYLKQNMFVHERSLKALYMPPFKSFWALRTAYMFESFGRIVFPGLAGVHVIEASKQIYAGKLQTHKHLSKSRKYAITDPISS